MSEEVSIAADVVSWWMIAVTVMIENSNHYLTHFFVLIPIAKCQNLFLPLYVISVVIELFYQI